VLEFKPSELSQVHWRFTRTALGAHSQRG
jgi:hypothetical protein